MKREQGKKASQKRLNLTPFVRRQGQAGRRGGGGFRVRSLKREFGTGLGSCEGQANSPEAARQI
ncbi:hypothetical protein VW212_001495 [Campylobacter upsaliensis]|nr:hypothetical protein [Campylobacter upsaliensis]